MSEDISKEHLAKAFEFLKHTDSVKESRTNFFLISEAMLITAFVTATGSATLERSCILILGVLTALTWWMNVWRLNDRLDYIAKNFLLKDEVYRNCLTAAKGPHGKHFIVHFLPCMFLAFWLLMVLTVGRR